MSKRYTTIDSLFFSSLHFFLLAGEQKEKKKKGTRHAELRGKCLKACIIDARFHRETNSSLRVSTKRRVGVCLHTSLSIRDRTVNQEEQCKSKRGFNQVEIEISERERHLDN